MKYYICVLQMGFVDILTTNDPIIRHFGLEAAVQVLVLRLAVFIGQIFICLYVAVHIFCIYQTNCESLKAPMSHVHTEYGSTSAVNTEATDVSVCGFICKLICRGSS